MRDDDDDAMRDDATATRSTTATTGRACACARARDLADAARKGCRECYARLHRDEYGSPPWRRDDDAMRDDDEETYLGYSLRDAMERRVTKLAEERACIRENVAAVMRKANELFAEDE
jgi:hypothetical protein